MSAMSRSVRFLSKVLEKDVDFSILLAAGPVFVFCTLLLGLQRSSHFDLVVFAFVGMILCMKGRMRGWVYSFLLLVAMGLIRHAFFIENHHLWQLGIEGSILVGLAIIAAGMDLIHSREMNLSAQIDSKEKTQRFLEEELSKTRHEAQQEQITLRDRLSALQKDFDENLSEFSSLQVLNDVLRKTTAQTNQEREEIAQKFLERDRQAINLLEEIERLKSQIDLLREKIAERENELHCLQGPMQQQGEELARRDQEINRLQDTIGERECELNHLHGQMHEQGDELTRRDQTINLLQDSFAEREREFSRLQSQMHEQGEELTRRDQAIHILQERLQAVAHKEALYQELRKQFDEKNRVLHQTRVELFKTDTALQAMRLEQEQQKEFEISDVERVLSNELEDLEQERQMLEQENEKLFELATLLSNESSAQIMERLTQHKQKADLVPSHSKKQPSKNKQKKKAVAK
jgi:chromosome segregation ATPase